MCPFCLVTIALVASSAAGTGGVAALAGTILLKKSPTKIPTQTDEKEVLNGGNSNTGQTA